MEKKKRWAIVIAIIVLLIIISIVLFFVLVKNNTVSITLDVDGGTPISNIKFKSGEMINLPEEPTKEGYIFAGWTNENNEIIINGTIITENSKLKALWIENDIKTINISFDTSGGNEIEDIIIEKGTIIKLPVIPIKKGYIFAGWIDENNNIIQRGTKIDSDIKLKALWISKDAKTVNISFNTDGGNEIEGIIIEKGTIIRLPIAPIKDGYVFAGWTDEKGNIITKDMTINEKITLKATWKEPYTCPNDCTPSADGKTCTKVITTSTVIGYGCPSGYTLKENQCLDLSTEYDRDAWSQAGGNPRDDGKCLSTEGSYIYIFEMGAQIMCAKKTNKITTTGCPNGYTKDGNICKKSQTVACIAN